MGRVLPISILNEQEAKTDFRTGTRFSILEVVAAKIQLGKLWSQMIKWNSRTWCTNNFFSDRVQTQETQRKSNLEIIQVRSARDDILFLHSQKSELQWMNPFMVNLLMEEPPLPPRAVPDGFSQKTEDDVQGGSWMTQFAEEWHSQIVPPLFPAQPCSCCCGVSKLPALLDVKGGEAGQEKLERSLGIAQLEGGQLEAGLKLLGIYKDLIFVPLFPSLTEPRSCHGTLHGVTKMLET